MEWWENIEPKVFNTLKVRVTKELAQKFPHIYFTSQVQTISESKLPCVYLHIVDMREVGADFEHLDMCGVDVTFQCDIDVNTTQNDCTAIASCVMAQMKKLRLTVNQGPIYYVNNGSNVIRGIVRASRLFGANDNL